MRGDYTICIYCGCHDERVEAGGMWFCPNPLCPGCGTHWFLRTLEWHQETRGTYEVNREEWERKGRLYLAEHPLKFVAIPCEHSGAIQTTFGMLCQKCGDVV